MMKNQKLCLNKKRKGFSLIIQLAEQAIMCTTFIILQLIWNSYLIKWRFSNRSYSLQTKILAV